MPERIPRHGVHPGGPAELHHDRAALVRHQPEVPQEQVQVVVVAVSEEQLRVGGEQAGIEVPEHLQFVLAADGREDGLDLRVLERGVHVGRPLLGRRVPRPRGRVLHRPEPEVLTQPGQAQVNRRWEDRWRAPGR
jgi:hypothetical protein